MVRACLHCSGRENNDSEIYLEIVGIAPRLEPLAVAVEGLGYESGINRAVVAAVGHVISPVIENLGVATVIFAV